MPSENNVIDPTAWMNVPVAYTQEDKLLITQLAGVLYSPEQIHDIFLGIAQKEDNLSKLRKSVSELHARRAQTAYEDTKAGIDKELEMVNMNIIHFQKIVDESRKEHHLVIKAKYFAYEYTAPYKSKFE